MIFLVELVQFSTMSHENSLSQLGEAVSHRMTQPRMITWIKRSYQHVTEREVQNEDLDSEEEENSNTNKYLTSLHATRWSCTAE